jgi:sugar/nucleoside kinase (ribokinase family)
VRGEAESDEYCCPPVSTPQLVTIGHAIVDVLGHSDDAFIAANGLTKGVMQLVEADQGVAIYNGMAERARERGEALTQISGGSAANTAVVAAMLGTPAAFIGKVNDDPLGDAFVTDIHSVGVTFTTLRSEPDSPPTGRSMINVTPDAQRTMATYLGAARGLRVPDMDMGLLTGAQVTYVEGYLWDELLARDGLHHAIDVVHQAGQRFSLSLADPFCVDRFRDEWLHLIADDVDIVFGNEAELESLLGIADLDQALYAIGERCEIAAITLGERGSVVVHDGTIEYSPLAVVPDVVDTTGAGDAYAGGFLHGFCQGLPMLRCAELGSLAAGEVISRLGARPSAGLVDLVSRHS